MTVSSSTTDVRDIPPMTQGDAMALTAVENVRLGASSDRPRPEAG